MYAGRNFGKKEDLAKAVEKGEKVTIFQPRKVRKYTGRKAPVNGLAHVEGPWLERGEHDWHADVLLKDGKIVEVI